jgi:putative sigma-54 modulation protein
MEYQVYSKQLEVTDSLREYLDMKLEHVDKLSVAPIACRVDLSRDQHHRKGDIFRVEINMNVPGNLLRIVEQHSDIRAAIDLATDKLIRQLQKFKGKKIDTKRRLGRLMKSFKRDE